MKYFKDDTNQVFAYEADGSQDAHIPDHYIPISKLEAEKLANPQTDSDLAKAIRHKRTLLIQQSDWTQMPDAPLTKTEKESWKLYRQDLRNITDQSTFPKSVTWPKAPN